MAETTIGNWFDKVFFDAHGEPCAGGALYFYQTGTNIPCGVVTAGGVLLGACVRLDDDGRPVEDFRFYADRSYRVVLKDADGAVVKQIDDVCIAQTEGGGMLNPMTALGDLIVGGEDGVPSRLGVGTAGQVPTAQEDGSIVWEDTRGFGKVSAASGDASASYLDNKLDVTTPLAKEVTTGQHNIKRVKLSVSAGDTAGKVLTTTDNGLGVLVPTWQTPTGMENPMTAKADIIVGGASGAPDKLAAPANASFLRAYKNSSNEDVVNWSKLSAGSGVSITDAGSQVTIAATEQSGDHKLLVSDTDAAAGYLGAKLTAGSNITITPQTDGDGVQTLEISSTGGGGGGGGVKRQTLVRPWLRYSETTGGANNGQMYWYPFVPDFDTITGFGLIWGDNANTTPVVLDVAIYEGTAAGTADKISSFTRVNKTVLPFNYVFFDFNSDVNIDITKQHWIAVCASAPINGGTGANLIGEEMFIQNGSQKGVELGANYYRVNATPAHLPTSGVSSIRFRPSVVLVGK